MAHPSPARQTRAPSPLLSRLTVLRKEVRSLSRTAQALARRAGKPGTDEYRADLAHLVDDWIRRSNGRRQLLCMASAAELNVLRAEHVRLCEAGLRPDGDEALRVLFWTSARRHAANLRRLPAVVRQPAPGQAGTQAILCEDCVALMRDARRCWPHAALRPVGVPASPSGQARYRCATCAVQWLRHKQRHELFFAWTPIGGPVP
ncbi:hypothetical protein CF68_35830 [Cupriavidus sp. SK-4]|nr:hypothetical protein CF68_35830 [Cupriavidus sp. SK-4]